MTNVITKSGDSLKFREMARQAALKDMREYYGKQGKSVITTSVRQLKEFTLNQMNLR